MHRLSPNFAAFSWLLRDNAETIIFENRVSQWTIECFTEVQELLFGTSRSNRLNTATKSNTPRLNSNFLKSRFQDSTESIKDVSNGTVGISCWSWEEKKGTWTNLKETRVESIGRNKYSLKFIQTGEVWLLLWILLDLHGPKCVDRVARDELTRNG